MNSYTECKAINELDLDPIKVKLMHKESGEGWTLAQANAVEAEYRRFLYLMKVFPTEAAAPLMDVDTFWHYHILDTLKYAQDCEAVFGYFLHHFPYVGLRGEDDLAAHESMGERMRTLYEETFGEKYRLEASRHNQQTAFSSAPGTAFSSAPGVAFSSAPGVAFSSAPGVAFSSAPGHSAGEQALRASFSPGQPVAFSSAPGQRTSFQLDTSFSPSPAIAFSSAPGQPARKTIEKTARPIDEFFSTRPRLETAVPA
jgi:hypothetical protein